MIYKLVLKEAFIKIKKFNKKWWWVIKKYQEKRKMTFTNEETSNILKLLLETENSYISILNTDGKYLYKNPSLTKLLSINDSLNNASFFNLIHTDDIEQIQDAFKKVISSGKEQVIEHRFSDYNSNIHRVKSYLKILSRKENNVEKILIVSNNLLEEKDSEEEINKLKIIAEQTSDHVVITNKEGIIEYINPAFEKTTGYTKEESLGKTLRKLISGKNDQKFYDEVWKKISCGNTFHGEVVNKTKNGDYFSCNKTITPIKDKNGNITHFVSTSKTLEE